MIIDYDKDQLSYALANALKERDEAREKMARQADRIRYLEGATNHAEGTPLSIALKERDEAVNELHDIRLNLGADAEGYTLLHAVCVLQNEKTSNKMQTELEMWRDGNILHEIHRNELEKVELERDEARSDRENSRQSLGFALEELEEARNEIHGWKNKWRCAVEMAARAELERDQLKEMPLQLLQAECRAERFCQERDDLRVVAAANVVTNKG